MNNYDGPDFSFDAAVLRICLLFALILALCPNAGAQSTALLNGTVSDPSGAADSVSKSI